MHSCWGTSDGLPATEMLSTAIATRNQAQPGILSCMSLGWEAYTVLKYPYSAACCRTDKPACGRVSITCVKPTMTGFIQLERVEANMKSTQAGRAGGLSLAPCMLQGACPEGAPRLWPHASLNCPAVGIRHRYEVPGRYSAERYSTDHTSRPCFLRKEVKVLLRSALGISCGQSSAYCG